MSDIQATIHLPDPTDKHAAVCSADMTIKFNNTVVANPNGLEIRLPCMLPSDVEQLILTLSNAKEHAEKLLEGMMKLGVMDRP
jgi:hypothetical protein